MRFCALSERHTINRTDIVVIFFIMNNFAQDAEVSSFTQ
jgi:hypothetical protein